MSEYCKVSDLKELTFKGGKKVLGFNVFYLPEDTLSGYIVIPGFILLAGGIYPPKVLRKGNWYPSVYIGRYLADLIYDHLEAILGPSSYSPIHKLNLNKKQAVEALIDEGMVTRMFPELVTGIV